MCGINGFTFEDKRKIDLMNERIKHRGPDRQASVVFARASLGVCRLAIIDLSPAGNQPMPNPENERFWIAYNGEIYNFRELRHELERRGHAFRSESDTEVILHGIEKDGPSFIKKLNGIFAFAVWDAVKEELIFARDPIGVKPLYYFWDGKRFVFSSEIKAILLHGVPRDIDEKALKLYFQLSYVPAPRTIFKNIFKLEPGTFGRLAGGKLSVERYGEVRDFKKTTLGFREARGELRKLTEDAVRRQLVADVPVGVFLSGGIDSTVVAALAKKFHMGPLKTFTIGFRGHAASDERKFNQDFHLARLTARQLGAEHHEVVVGGSDVADILEESISQMDEPVSNPTQVPTRLLARFARKIVTVALGGDGGDELFGGYPRYWFNQLLNFYQRVPAPLRRFLAPYIELASDRKRMAEKLETPRGVKRYLLFLSQKEDELARILKPEFLPHAEAEEYFSGIASPFPWVDEERELMRLDLKTWLPEESLMRTDKMTMAESLEERVPWLDHRIVDFAFSLPTSWKIKRGKGKRIVREAFRDLIPAHVLAAPKRGWFSPAAKWVRGELKPLAEKMLSPGYAPGSERYIDFDGVREVWREHLERRAYHHPLLWSLITFQAWYKAYLGDRP